MKVWKNSSWVAPLPRDELHVVHQQQVDVAVSLLEVGHLPGAQGGDEVVGELLGGDVAHLEARGFLQRRVSDRVQQVRLPQADAPVDEERVVAVSGLVGDRDGCRVGELVSGTDDEPVERVPVVQRTEHRPGARGGLLGELEQPGRDGSRGKRVLLLAPDQDLDGHLLRELLPRDLLDPGEMVLLDPLLEELVGGGDEEDRTFPRDEPQGAQPRLEHLFAHLAAQLGEYPFPRLRGHAAGSRSKAGHGRESIGKTLIFRPECGENAE